MKNTTIFAIAGLIATITANAFATGENIVASKGYVDNKFQDKITTGLLEINDFDSKLDLPSLVSYDSINGLTGNKIGFLNTETHNNMNASYQELLEADADKIVPSLQMVITMNNDIWNAMPIALVPWSTTQTNATNNYSTTFNGTTNNWANGDSNKMITGTAFSEGLALKQNKIPAGTAGNVVTYSGTAGTVGSAAVASAATYNVQTGALTNGSDIANVTLVETKQAKKVCAGWPDSVAIADRTDANCWLWQLPD